MTDTTHAKPYVGPSSSASGRPGITADGETSWTSTGARGGSKASSSASPSARRTRRRLSRLRSSGLDYNAG